MHRSEVFSQLFDVGVDILATSFGKVTGIVLAQLGDVGTEKADSDGAELWQQTGFYSRPAPPSQGGAACQGIVLKSGDRDLIIATSDKRASGIYGNLAAGEACAFATVGQARSLWKADGSVRHQTTDDNAATGKAMFYGMSPKAANPSAKGGEWRVYAPFGGEWQDSTGFHRQHWFGGTTDTGVQTMPLVPGVQLTTLTESYDVITLSGAVVVVGRQGTTSIPDQLVQGTWAAATFALVATALTAIGAALTAITAIAANAAAAGAAATAVGAISAAAAALGTTKAAGTTKSTSAT